MKKHSRRLAVIIVAVTMTITMSFSTGSIFAASKVVTSTNGGKAKVSVDWNLRYTYDQLESQLKKLNKAYPKFSKLYSVGTTNEKRTMWCMKITDESVPNANKTKTAIVGNIHGGERESASCAMYSIWYLLENSGNASVKNMLKKYVVYVIPVINPDGYTQSFVYNTRPNLKPVDHDGDGVAFNDTYKDINGDGYIANVSAVDSSNKVTGVCGRESNDANGDGILANDVKSSGIDLNRNFDYMWGEDGTMDTEGPSAASEVETKAVQNFFKANSDISCMVTLHTGIQCVLYPWCWRPAYKDLDNMEDIAFMNKTAGTMAKTIAAGTQRNFYYKSSYADYQTYSELIDYTYGKFGIHSYTVEVYSGGSSSDSAYNPNRDFTSDAGCMWNNTLPATKTVYYTHDEAVKILQAAGVDPAKLKVMDSTTKQYRSWADTEGLQFVTSSSAQMVDKAPADQDIMVKGVAKGLITMIKSEPTKSQVQALKVSKLKAAVSKSKVKLSWNKAKLYVNGYQIYKSTKKSSGYSKLATTKNTTYTNMKGLKKGKAYYYKVRPYKQVGDKVYYGKWIKVKAVAK